LGGNLSGQLVVIRLVADMLVPEHLTIHLDLVTQIVGLVVHLGVVVVMLRNEIGGQDPAHERSISLEDVRQYLWAISSSLFIGILPFLTAFRSF
jgi:uncharacterized membrane protein YgaE (UPF0421/DUF939 family)